MESKNTELHDATEHYANGSEASSAPLVAMIVCVVILLVMLLS